MTQKITQYNDIFQDVLPRNYIYKDLQTQINMFYTAMILNEDIPRTKTNYLNSAFNQLPDCYSKLSTDNKLSVYMQIYHKQQKDLAWRKKEKLDQELNNFEKSLEEAILNCDELSF